MEYLLFRSVRSVGQNECASYFLARHFQNLSKHSLRGDFSEIAVY